MILWELRQKNEYALKMTVSENVRGYLHATGVCGGESSMLAKHEHKKDLNPPVRH